MEIGIGLTFGAFLVETALFLATMSAVVVRPALRTHAMVRSLLLGVMVVLAVLAMAFPAVLLGDVVSAQSGFAWPYIVVLLCAPLMALSVAVLFRRGK
jgi:hypothetical protein